MADQEHGKTPLDLMQDTLAQLKEMAHYAQGNIEKLATLWLTVSESKSQKKYEDGVDEVLKQQNRFQEAVAALIEEYERDAAQLKAEADKAAADAAAAGEA